MSVDINPTEDITNSQTDIQTQLGMVADNIISFDGQIMTPPHNDSPFSADIRHVLSHPITMNIFDPDVQICAISYRKICRHHQVHKINPCVKKTPNHRWYLLWFYRPFPQYLQLLHDFDPTDWVVSYHDELHKQLRAPTIYPDQRYSLNDLG
eukprot:scaffold54555_cov69-Attheya_sp.AAC.3